MNEDIMRFSRLMPALALLLLVSACGSSKEDNQVTETRMDNLESLKGTISDDMINTDESTDEAPLDAAVAEPANAEVPKTDAAKASPTETEPAGTTKPDTASEPK